MSNKEKKWSRLDKVIKSALDIVNDPEKYKDFQKRMSEFFPKLNEMEERFKELDKCIEDSDKKWVEKHPEQAACDHGLTFDEEAANKLLEGEPTDQTVDPEIAFIIGSPAHAKIRKLWPRLNGPCPKGCGYNGIAYASYAHYTYGDW